MKAERITPFGYGLSYFTTCSLLKGDRRIILIHRMEDDNQVSCMDLDTGEIHDISHTPSVPSLAFDASVCVDSEREKIYYLRDRIIYRTDPEGNEIALAMIPLGMHTVCTHINDNGDKFLLSTSDNRMIAGDEVFKHASYSVDERAQLFGYSTQLRVFSTKNGDLLQKENVNRAYVSHVQFAPGNDRLILYNHEWSSDCGVRRIWLYDGENHIQLRTVSEGRDRNDWVCHELWAADGKSLLYHGAYCHDKNGNPTDPEGKDSIHFLGRIIFTVPGDYSQYTIEEIPFPEQYRKYGHFIVGENGLIVTDGYYQEDDEDPRTGSRFISLLLPDWEQKTIRWVPLCEHGSTWKEQRSHPHPIFDHACRYVYFNSDREGDWAVYRVPVPEEYR